MRTDTPTLDAPGRAPGAATDDELRELDTVSYTHLTLPTIYSV